MSTIGTRIREVRQQKNLSQAEFARELGFGQHAISDFERDRKVPGGVFLIALKTVFDVSLDWLATGHLPLLISGGNPATSPYIKTITTMEELDRVIPVVGELPGEAYRAQQEPQPASEPELRRCQDEVLRLTEENSELRDEAMKLNAKLEAYREMLRELNPKRDS
ncbi:MAG: helix-turn-helix domain-containing protein [Bacteroidota bacterium]